LFILAIKCSQTQIHSKHTNYKLQNKNTTHKLRKIVGHSGVAGPLAARAVVKFAAFLS